MLTKSESKGCFINNEGLDPLIVLHPVQLLNIQIPQVTSKIGLLKLVQIVPQLLQVISYVHTNINIVLLCKECCNLKMRENTILHLHFHSVSSVSLPA